LQLAGEPVFTDTAGCPVHGPCPIKFLMGAGFPPREMKLIGGRHVAIDLPEG
jgi:hypothetical protein